MIVTFTVMCAALNDSDCIRLGGDEIEAARSIFESTVPPADRDSGRGNVRDHLDDLRPILVKLNDYLRVHHTGDIKPRFFGISHYRMQQMQDEDGNLDGLDGRDVFTGLAFIADGLLQPISIRSDTDPDLTYKFRNLEDGGYIDHLFIRFYQFCRDFVTNDQDLNLDLPEPPPLIPNHEDHEEFPWITWTITVLDDACQLLDEDVLARALKEKKSNDTYPPIVAMAGGGKC